MPNLANDAIKAALRGDWEKAISLNEQILKENPENTNALTRLAFAYLQTNKIEEAKRIYKKILAKDPYHLVAKKNLEKIAKLSPQTKSLLPPKKTTNLSPTLFLEEPGKTKIVSLTHIAPFTNLSHLNIGNPVFLYPKKHSVEIRDENKTYIGALPDDLSFRLLQFIKGGNTYSAYIKNINKNNILIFLRETKRGKRFSSQPSFISSLSSLVKPQNSSSQKLKDDSEEDEEKTSQEEEEI